MKEMGTDEAKSALLLYPKQEPPCLTEEQVDSLILKVSLTRLNHSITTENPFCATGTYPRSVALQGSLGISRLPTIMCGAVRAATITVSGLLAYGNRVCAFH